MRLKVEITGLNETVRSIVDTFSENRMRNAMSTALTRTADDVQRAWEAGLASKLDRPTPATLRSVVRTRATGASLQAEVFIKDQSSGTAPAEWLAPEERGGQRRLKLFEMALAKTGALPPGTYVVPGPGAKLDGYGNVSRGQIVQVIAQLGAQYSPGYQRVISKTASKRAQKALLTGRAYVAIPQARGNLPAGIYERKARGLVAVFYIVSRAIYRPRTGLVETAQQVAATSLPLHMRRAIEESVARVMSKR